MRELDKKFLQAHRKLAIKPGDIYESCSCHPVLCLGVDYKIDEIWGVSLIDGGYPQSCSLLHCGIRKLSPKQAWQIKMNGPLEADIRENIKPENRWWRENTEALNFHVGLVGPLPEKPAGSKSAG